MKYVSLDKVRNGYPLDKQKQGGIISQTYTTTSGGDIINQGQTQIPGQFPPVLLPQRYRGVSVKTVAGTNFRFIIDIDGIRYTSPEFASDLEKATAESNPYFNESTVTTISISSKQITTPQRKYKVGLEYAETTVLPGNNLYNGDPISIVKYIDSLVQPTKGQGTSELSDVRKLGSWKTSISSYNPTTDTGMGVELTDLLLSEKENARNI